MSKRKIIFDTDPGIDDAYAIITAMKYKDFDVLGLCTVAGNKGIDFTTTNALEAYKQFLVNGKGSHLSTYIDGVGSVEAELSSEDIDSAARA